jgi:ParB family transcriptional regulator, chromosome partitioning protein
MQIREQAHPRPAARPRPELDELKASIRAIGLSNPIRVEQVGEGYELVQGFRRLMAYRELHAETGEERFAHPGRAPAAGRKPRQPLSPDGRREPGAPDISFAEMAMLVLNYMEDHPAEATTCIGHGKTLFQRKSTEAEPYRTFVRLMQDIGHAMRHPEAIPRALGSDLVRKFEEDDGLALRSRRSSTSCPRRPRRRRNWAFCAPRSTTAAAPGAADTPDEGRRAKTTLKLARPEGWRSARRRTEGRAALPRDFSSSNGRGSKQAVEAFLDALDG